MYRAVSALAVRRPVVANCSSCGASLSDSAVFCGTCGKPTATTAAGAPASAAPSQSARIITPDTAQAMRQAASRAQTVAANLGPEKITSLVGGVLGVVGTMLPFYSIAGDSMLGDASVPTPTLVSEGGIGICFIVLAAALAATPFVMVPSRLVSLIGFGLAAAALGVLIGDQFAFSLFGQSAPISFGIGYYLTFLGFAALAFGHGRRANEAS
jgi:hypothetical protein